MPAASWGFLLGVLSLQGEVIPRVGALQHPTAGPIVLREIRRLQLPAGQTPRSAVILPGGAVAVALSSDLRVVYWSDSATRWLDLPTNVPALALRSTDDEAFSLEALLDLGGRVAEFSQTGGVLREHWVAMPDSASVLRDVAGTRRGWVLAVSDSIGDLQILSLSQARLPRLLLAIGRDSLAHLLPDSTSPLRVHLGEVCPGVLAATLWWAPFTTILVNLDGGVRRTLDDALADLPSRSVQGGNAGAGLAPLLASMPVVGLPTGFARTVTDLRSNARWIVLYDGQGIRQRVSSLASPLALVAARPDEGLVLASLQLSAHELILYRAPEITGLQSGVCK